MADTLPTGVRIAREVEREMEMHLYPMRFSVLAPAEYHVFLHPEDFARLERVVPLITQDVQLALNARVSRLNRHSMLDWITTRPRRPVEIPAGGWSIHIRPAANQELQRGELLITSRLSIPVPARFGSGTDTVRIFETRVSGGTRTTTIACEDASTTAATTMAVGSSRTRVIAPMPVGARLSYTDGHGLRDFVIRKDLIKIGRGGDDHWVDITITASSKVSREHCRIRADVPARRFFVQDFSTWGTSVNGERLLRYSPADQARTEYEVEDGDSIQLADENDAHLPSLMTRSPMHLLLILGLVACVACLARLAWLTRDDQT